ncbi:hypothetical protein [Streptomyces werraensis]|uniref:hypothetical protein n=1 Tax=Streptomyces werraensis TaxID=68284 RepID=UPI0038043D67
MIKCTYDPDHFAVAATHYYDTAGGRRVSLCFGCASRFGYPQYLVEYPLPYGPEESYLITHTDGSGVTDWDAEIWPLPEDVTELYLAVVLGPREAQYMIGDASWEPYRAHQATSLGGVTMEIRQVKSLPLV